MKSKKNIFGIILFIVSEILILILEKKVFFGYFPYDRVFLLTILNIFICIHFFVDLKKFYDLLYKKRYIIGVIILLFCTFRGYNGSSLSIWNDIVQPKYRVSSGNVVLGEIRDIRGDEYAVGLPTTFSQKYNHFSSKSNILMGRKEKVILYPYLPSWHVSILGNLVNIGYLFLPLENAYSFFWFSKIFLIFFATFEMFMIITNENRKYSFLGAILITLSGANCWWSNMTILGIGALAVVILKKFFDSNSIKKRLLLSIIMGIIGANYIFLLYPAWQIPFGYVYFILFLWIIKTNREKLRWNMLLYCVIVLIIIGFIFIPTIIDSRQVYEMVSSTVYPGSRLSLGGHDFDKLFSYFINPVFSIKKFQNPCEYANFMSLYPIPLVISFYLIAKNIFKKKKNDFLLISLSCLGLLLSVWNFIELPKIIVKITFLYMSTENRCQLAVGYICIILIIMIISKYNNNNKIKPFACILKILFSAIFTATMLNYYNSVFDDYLSFKVLTVLFVIFTSIISLFLVNNKKTNSYLIILLIFISIFTGLFVNPLSKGIGVFYEKPVSSEIKKILKNDKNARWIVINSNYMLPNYFVANGASTINSTNFYPNMDLWKKFDKGGENDFVYNRYAHVKIDLTEDKTSFELLYTDSFVLHLNIDDISKIKARYIVSSEKISDVFLNKIKCIYKKDGIYIYKVK